MTVKQPSMFSMLQNFQLHTLIMPCVYIGALNKLQRYILNKLEVCNYRQTAQVEPHIQGTTPLGSYLR